MKKLSIIFLIFYVFSINSFCQEIDMTLNLSFERLDTVMSLSNWSHSTFGYQLTKDAVHGQNAVQISHWYNYRYGILALGNKDVNRFGSIDNFIESGVPFKKKPSLLKGFYKYSLNKNGNTLDSGEVILALKKIDPITQKRKIIGYGYLRLGAINNFTTFQMPINYLSNELPDSLALAFYSSYNGIYNGNNYVSTSNNTFCEEAYCLFLTLDNLSFDYTTPTDDIDSLKSPIKIHPNPTSNSIQIGWGENSVSDIIIKDTLGRIIQKKRVNTEGVNLDLSSLPMGLYFIEFNQNGKHLATRKVVKQ